MHLIVRSMCVSLSLSLVFCFVVFFFLSHLFILHCVKIYLSIQTWISYVSLPSQSGQSQIIFKNKIIHFFSAVLLFDSDSDSRDSKTGFRVIQTLHANNNSRRNASYGVI